MSRVSWTVGRVVTVLVAAATIGSCRPRETDSHLRHANVRVGDLVISDGYVAAPMVDHVTMAYVTIENIGTQPDALVGAKSDVAARVVFLSQVLDGPLGRSVPVERILIAPGHVVVLEPGGFHLILEDLRVPLAPGDSVTVQLRFERAGAATVRLPVLPQIELVRRQLPAALETAG
jgi:copper(I)-binding protein